MLGTLYGIGVGPGDPELLTVKAIRVLHVVDHVFAASSTKNDYSLALEIAREHLKPNTAVDFLDFPMTFDSNRLETAWHANCLKVTLFLEQGRNVAFLTLGDPMTFSTFVYLMRKVQSRLPEVPIEIVPGITSFQAAAACAAIPLAEGEESITVISGAKGGNRLKEAINVSDNVVLMKAYKQFANILENIKELGLQKSCCFVSRCGLEGEVIEKNFEQLEKVNPHYLSLMILKKKGIEL